LWPDPVPPVPLFVSTQATGGLPRWVRWLPAWSRRALLRRRLKIAGQPDDAHRSLAVLANCAPYLLRALQEQHWHAIVLIQSSMTPWLEYLPEVGAKVMYFHDVRSDYFGRSTDRRVARSVRQVHYQEQLASDNLDAAGFVSELDLTRAQRLLRLPVGQHVSPIPVDTDYFVPRRKDWKKDPRKIALFTGHLAHPPNIDALTYFLTNVWPKVLELVPDAVFQAVGLSPAPRLQEAMEAAEQCELYANVPDIRPYFWNADVYVVPMRYGGGVRQKIFEAWAMQLPVISTTMGAEGTGAKHDENCFLRDGADEMAQQIADVLREGSPPRIAAAAYTHVCARNSIRAAAGEFEQLSRLGANVRRKRPFKLLYDLRWMEIGKAGGIEQMTYELVHHVSRLDHRNRYRIYAPRSTYHEWDLDPAFSCQPYFTDASTARLEVLEATVTNRLAESVGLPGVLTAAMRTLRTWRQMDFDLVHAPVGYLHPDLEAFPHIVTVHDLQHLTFPQFFSEADWKTREYHYRESAKRATHIIAISEFTRQDLHRRYEIPLEKITTIWNIPSSNVWMPLPTADRQLLLRQLGLDGPFLLFPAHSWPHKNHVRLLEAFELILPHIAKDIKLVLTGRPFEAGHPAQLLMERESLRGRVLHLGYRSPLEMKALFHGCLLLVFPSLFEGFGMPVAEAIIAEKPVACSGTTSLPEIAGDAALTFDPENIHDMGGRLLEIINDPVRREHLIAAARRRRTLFSARLVALKTISLYQRVHEALYQV
ncbi:MAG TPA: glycosyltransferase, partial [Candidatus Didemnitutus sp.]|nr:glycosyltransferase [Candidatus Didemnitutus sp.]